jgi:hypothetical protein
MGTWRRLALGWAVTALALGPGSAAAEQWGGLEPGVSTMLNVSSLRGDPTRKGTQKVDGYDTAEWIYEGPKAPGGINRMTIDFGLMTPTGYRAELVRSFKLEPKPGAFDRDSVIAGWGPPAGVGKDGEIDFFFYKEGLFVYFDKDGFKVASLVFTPPQLPPAEGAPRR